MSAACCAEDWEGATRTFCRTTDVAINTRGNDVIFQAPIKLWGAGNGSTEVPGNRSSLSPSLRLFVPLRAKPECGPLHAPSEGSQEWKAGSWVKQWGIPSFCHLFLLQFHLVYFSLSTTCSVLSYIRRWLWKPPWAAWEVSEAGQNPITLRGHWTDFVV